MKERERDRNAARRLAIIRHAQEVTGNVSKTWETFYNFNRPQGGLGGQTPYERQRQKTKSSV